jgi:glutamate-1-semialdehyde 2,1-aminomutase
LDEIRRGVEEDGFVGLKCYHVYSDHRPTFDSEVEDFLPESQVQLAGELGLVVMLHLVCSRALAEKSNRDWIRATCRKYPRMRLILAHAARGFNPHHTIHGIDDLRGLENVWFDTSAVTECGAFEAILSVFGHRRLLYGSDFPVSHLRGRCVAICDTFVWLTPEDLPREVEYAMLSPALVGLESLRVLKLAARHTRLSDRQVEDVFYHNALALWNDG